MQKRPKGWETARDDPNHLGELLVLIDGKEYAAQDIVSCEIERNLLENTAEVGNATAAVLTLEISQRAAIPKRARIEVKYRLALNDARTDYIPKGIFWINTREKAGRYLKLTCYDAMLMTQQDYLSDVTADDWPKQETDCVAEIARRIGTEIDLRTKIGTGDNHRVSMPVGRTMREVLEQIAAANGGNWCITPAGRLLLVPFAGTGDALPAVSGVPDCGAVQSITGVRVVRNDTDTPLLAGTETGTVLEVENESGTQALADELAQKLVGLLYAPYTCGQRYIDPAAEAGDKITIGGTACVAYNIKESLGPSHYADLEAPEEAGELEEEYPYQTATERVKKQLGTVTTSVAEIRKDQESITAEVSKTKKDIAEQLKSYSTTKETKSLIDQKADSIKLEVSETYVTSDDLGDYAKKSDINVAFNGITLKVEQKRAWENQLDGSDWTGKVGVTTGSGTSIGITGNNSTESQASLYVPSSKLAYFQDMTARIKFQYKIVNAISGGQCQVVLWQSYKTEGSTGAYVKRFTTSTTDKAAVTAGWVNASVDLKLKADLPTKLQLTVYIVKGATGRIDFQNVQIQVQRDGASVISLNRDGVEISSDTINITGFVKFSDLEETGATTINGSNITTGKIGNSNGNTLYDLDTGTLRTGTSASTRVEIDAQKILWYYQNYLTGILYSEYAKTYIGCNSRYLYVGWFGSKTPSLDYTSLENNANNFDGFFGLMMDQVHKTIHAHANAFKVQGEIECVSIKRSGSYL